jgi:hypothetical protein
MGRKRIIETRKILRPGKPKCAAGWAATQTGGKVKQEQASEPIKKLRKREKTGMIALRVERMTKRLVRSMKECSGASFETHADACRMGTSTFYRWMADGEKEPASVYGRFRQAMQQAMAQGEKALHRAAMRTHAMHLLARRFPHHYPSERQLMELSAPGGLPLIPASENQFNVVLELHPQEQAGAPEPEPVFRIVKPGGASADLWPPLANGERPPHK